MTRCYANKEAALYYANIESWIWFGLSNHSLPSSPLAAISSNIIDPKSNATLPSRLNLEIIF